MVIKKLKVHLIFCNLLLLSFFVYPQKILLDDFESLNDWKIYKSDGVEAGISSVEGFSGKAIKYTYDFTKGSGYGGIQKSFHIDLRDNYQFTFLLKAESPNNNFEIKFLDKSGDNVWWVNNRNYEFPHEWKKITIKKRHISFAWGPTENKNLRETDKIEFTIASFTGGKGSIIIDDLYFEELPPVTILKKPSVISAAGGSFNNYYIKNLNDNNPDTKWLSNIRKTDTLHIDFGSFKEIGGFIIDWDKNYFPDKYGVYLSNDGDKWEKFYSAELLNGERSYIRLPDAEAQYAKIILHKNKKSHFGIKELKITEPEYSEDINRFFINIARDYPRGYYPRYLYEEASYWNVAGANSDIKEALISEDGIVETDKARFSVEPMVSTDGKLFTWNEAEKEQYLMNNYLPVPGVKWKFKDFTLNIETFVHGEANKNSVLYINYNLENNSSSLKQGKVYILFRPFQVNPYYQELNLKGGVSRISSISIANDVIKIDEDKFIYPLTPFQESGAVMFEEGNLISLLAEDNIPVKKNIKDQFKLGSGVLVYDFKLKQGEEKNVSIAVPFYGDNFPGEVVLGNESSNRLLIEKLKLQTKEEWEKKLSHIKFNLPQSADKIINTCKSNLAYILINRDNAGIQPGSRSYERSWIRDGSLTSSALLKSGIKDEVKEFINWYSAYQYENGKIPCVVDSRGPDPVPENDSHGEYIFLVKQYYNFTKDTAFLREKNKYILKTVDYINNLVSQRLTDHFKNSNDSVRAYYGIMPESISHEGYSAKPMHSYWDNFFTIKGLKDAADIQYILGEKESYENTAALRDQFRTNLYNSLKLAVKTRDINYIPGCVELGDFDATSTTIALYPCNEYPNLPLPYLNNTFDKYYELFTERRDEKRDWINYTPYEVRTIGSFIFLDQPERAHQLIDFFLKDQRPNGWNHWPEVVWKDERKPAFIGDMPHTWVGSDFINAIRAMLVYENDYDSSLVIGAGLYQDWIDSPDGMSVENIPTYYGEISYSVKKLDNVYNFKIYGDLTIPSGGIIIKNFNRSGKPVQVLLNGKKIDSFSNNKILINEIPAEIVIEY